MDTLTPPNSQAVERPAYVTEYEYDSQYWMGWSEQLDGTGGSVVVQLHLVNWITGLGATARDFWLNWVVDPIGKVIRTIRHDANSEIAFMSRESLRVDRESLERHTITSPILRVRAIPRAPPWRVGQRVQYG